MRCTDRGFEFAAENPLYCPRCQRQALERCLHRQGTAALCPRCAGVWTAPTCWDSKHHGPLPEAVPPAAPAKRQSGVVMRAALMCPDGHGQLHSVRIGSRQGCHIDQCPICGGIWLDHGEWEYLEALQMIADQNRELERPGTWKEAAFQFHC